MADETPATAMVDKPAEEAAAPVEDSSGAKPDDVQAELTRMRDALKKANDEAKRYRLEVEKVGKSKEDAEKQRLAEEGRYKELFEKQQADLAEAQADAKSASLRILRREAAEKVGLPLVFADRLAGETADELEADAKTILAALPKPAAPNINAESGGQPSGSQMSETQIGELAARYGVNAKLLKQQYGM